MGSVSHHASVSSRSLPFLFLFILLNELSILLVEGLADLKRISLENLQHQSKSLSLFKDPTIVQQALHVDQRRAWWKHIQTRSKRELVAVERNNDHNILEMELLHALELIVHQSSEPISIASIASSCSTDQLPIDDTVDSLFQGNNGKKNDNQLSKLSPYFPIYDTLRILGHGATSTTEQLPLTRIVLSLAGGPMKVACIEGEEQVAGEVHFPVRERKLKTWEGKDFRLGRQSSVSIVENDPSSILVEPGDVMIFPAGVWYQCQGIRGEQPCVSVWTQRCNSLSTVVEDVLQSKALESVEKNTYQMDVENQDIILERIFELIDLYS